MTSQNTLPPCIIEVGFELFYENYSVVENEVSYTPLLSLA